MLMWRKRMMAVLVMAAMIISACSGSQSAATKTEQKPAGQATAPAAPATPAPSPGGKQDLTIGGGTIGGVYYIVATGLATVANKGLKDVRMVAEATAAGVENTRLVRDGKMTFGLTDPRSTIPAFDGTGEFKGEANGSNIRFVANGYPTWTQVIVRVDSGINTYKDLKGKKVCMSQGIQTSLLNELLYGYDMEVKDVQTVHQSLAQCASALKEGAVDVLHVTGGVPQPAVSEAFASSKAMKFLAMDQAAMEKINKKYPWFVPGKMAADAYPGKASEILTPEFPGGVIIANANISEDMVYRFLGVITASQEDLLKIHPSTVWYKAENMVKNTLGPVPMHPGATKFYKEKGVLK